MKRKAQFSSIIQYVIYLFNIPRYFSKNHSSFEVCYSWKKCRRHYNSLGRKRTDWDSICYWPNLDAPRNFQAVLPAERGTEIRHLIRKGTHPKPRSSTTSMLQKEKKNPKTLYGFKIWGGRSSCAHSYSQISNGNLSFLQTQHGGPKDLNATKTLSPPVTESQNSSPTFQGLSGSDCKRCPTLLRILVWFFKQEVCFNII